MSFIEGFPRHPYRYNRYQTQARFRSELIQWLDSLKFQIWATWTFGKNWPDGPTRQAVQYHVRRWLDQHDLFPAFFVIERGKSGQRRAHAHGLIGKQGPMQLDADINALWNDWKRRYGRSSFEPLNEKGGASAYCAKYCLKDLSRCDWHLTDGRPDGGQMAGTRRGRILTEPRTVLRPADIEKRELKRKLKDWY